jgi:hypothetical protein
MLATPEDEMMGPMSFASVTDTIAVAMAQWSVQHCAFIIETVF